MHPNKTVFHYLQLNKVLMSISHQLTGQEKIKKKKKKNKVLLNLVQLIYAFYFTQLINSTVKFITWCQKGDSESTAEYRFEAK